MNSTPMPREATADGPVMNRLVYRFVRFLFWLLFTVCFRFRVIGREHEPASGPVIVIANHASTFDPPAVGVALRRLVYFMGKQELFTQPVLRWVMPRLGGIPVRRGEPDRQAMRWSLEVLRRGQPLGIFIEGTRSPDGSLQPAEPGAAVFALRTGVPILPVAVVGGYGIMPKGAVIPRPGRIEVRIGPVFRLDGAGDGKSRREAIEQALRVMMDTLAGLLGEQAAPRA